MKIVLGDIHIDEFRLKLSN